MNVVAFLPADRLGRVTSALLAHHTLHVVEGLESIQSELDSGRADVSLVDLDACRDGDMRLLTAIVARHGSAIVVYARFAQPTVRTILGLARRGLSHVIYRGTDDHPTNVGRVLYDAAGSRIGGRIVSQLSPSLSSCRRGVRDAVGELFVDPLRFRCASDVAQSAGIARRSLDRTLHHCALEPARMWVLAARLTWAYPRLRAGSARVSDLSQELGISKPERFARLTRLLLGLPPSVVRTHVSPDQFVQLVVARLQRPSRSADADLTCDHPRGALTALAPSRSEGHALTS